MSQVCAPSHLPKPSSLALNFFQDFQNCFMLFFWVSLSSAGSSQALGFSPQMRQCPETPTLGHLERPAGAAHSREDPCVAGQRWQFFWEVWPIPEETKWYQTPLPIRTEQMQFNSVGDGGRSHIWTYCHVVVSGLRQLPVQKNKMKWCLENVIAHELLMFSKILDSGLVWATTWLSKSKKSSKLSEKLQLWTRRAAHQAPCTASQN